MRRAQVEASAQGRRWGRRRLTLVLGHQVAPLAVCGRRAEGGREGERAVRRQAITRMLQGTHGSLTLAVLRHALGGALVGRLPGLVAGWMVSGTRRTHDGFT